MIGGKVHCQVGLDAGNRAVRAVLLENGSPVDFREWDVFSEGGLEEGEFYDGIAAFLKKCGWDNYSVLAGQAQFRCSTLYKVFPEAAKKRLGELVAFETAQLSGVSEDRFLNSFCLLPGEEGGGQAVLIGICRERDLEELQRQYLRRKVKLAGMSMHGMALFNAFYDLHPEALKDEAPVFLLDLGQENATVVIAAAGRALFMGTLMFAGGRFVQALEECNRTLEKRGAALTLPEVDFENEALHSPLLETARALDGEIQNIVEHWRSQQADEYCGRPVSGIWLSGGGARIGTLAAWLTDHSEVPVKVLGPRWKGRICPEYAIAYGLALEAGGKSLCSLGLLSSPLAEERRRRKRLPWLAAGCLFFCLSLFAVEFLCWCRQGRELEKCREENRRLDECGKILPGIQFTYMDLKSCEKKILPLVVNGRNTDDIRKTIRLLSENLGEREWCVYLADYESCQAEAAERENHRKNSSSSPAVSSGFWNAAPRAAEENLTEFPGAAPVDVYRDGNADWVAAGFVPFDAAQPYFHVKKLTLKLRRHSMFREADLFQPGNGTDRVEIFIPWVRYLKENSRDYKSFTLLIPRKSHFGSRREAR